MVEEITPSRLSLQPPRQEEKKQQISSLWTDSLCPLCVSFFFPPPWLWADRIDFPPACGCISLRSASSLPHTLPPLPPPRLTCSLPSPALSLSLSLSQPAAELTEGWVPEPGYIHPLMFIKQVLIDYSWVCVCVGGCFYGGLPKKAADVVRDEVFLINKRHWTHCAETSRVTGRLFISWQD